MTYGLLGPDLGINTTPQFRPPLPVRRPVMTPPMPLVPAAPGFSIGASAPPPSSPVQMMANLPPEPAPQPSGLGGLLGAFNDGELNYGLLGLASGLMQAGGPSLTPQSAGSMGLQGLLQGQQAQAQMDEQKRVQAQQAAMDQAISQLPPEQQLAARANPEAFFGQQAKMFFPEPADLPAGMVMGPNGPEWIPGYLEGQARVRAAGRSNTTVTVDNPQYGTIPAGFQLIKDPQTGAVRMEPVAGSPASREAEAAAAAQEAAREQKETTANIVVQDIDRTLDMLENSTLPVAGAGGSVLQHLPGTASHDAAKLLESVRAASGFERLQQMREESPTGGALGQVTERELALLTSAMGNLDLSQSPPQFADNLKRVRNIFLDIIHGPGNGPARSTLGFQEPQQGDLSPEEQAILQQYGVQ